MIVNLKGTPTEIFPIHPHPWRGTSEQQHNQLAYFSFYHSFTENQSNNTLLLKEVIQKLSVKSLH